VLLAPILILLTINQNSGGENFSTKIKSAFPLFILGFFFILIIGNEVKINSHLLTFFNDLSKISLACGLFSMALGVKWKEIKAVGHKPVLFGLIMWVILGGVSLSIIELLVK
jgi:uncharacterized membrane protein YadS